jgi:hypothetical protein
MQTSPLGRDRLVSLSALAKRTVATSALLLALSGAGSAQLFVVDPRGGGTHTDLQAAINAAPAGAVIHVRRGTFGPLTITRSLTIVGGKDVLIRSPQFGTGAQPPAISLLGNGTESIVLANLVIRGLAGGATGWTSSGPGIRSNGFTRVAIHDCRVSGHEWSTASGLANSASGVEVAGAATLLVERSMVAASASDAGQLNQWAPAGAAAIDAPLAMVVVLDSKLHGGDAGASVFAFTPWTAPCPCPGVPGSGGHGIVAQSVIAANSSMLGGSGSPITAVGQPYGSQPDGRPIVAGNVTTMATTILQSAPFRLGTVLTIQFAATTGPAMVILGNPVTPPTTTLGVPQVFVDAAGPTSIGFLTAGARTSQHPIPYLTALLGLEVAAQRFDLGIGGISATNPILGAIVP